MTFLGGRGGVEERARALPAMPMSEAVERRRARDAVGVRERRRASDRIGGARTWCRCEGRSKHDGAAEPEGWRHVARTGELAGRLPNTTPIPRSHQRLEGPIVFVITGVENRVISIVSARASPRTRRYTRKGRHRGVLANGPPSWLRSSPPRFNANCMLFDDVCVAAQAFTFFRAVDIAPGHWHVGRLCVASQRKGGSLRPAWRAPEVSPRILSGMNGNTVR